MSDKTIKVLLVEDNPGDARLIREMLAEARGMTVALECADRLQAGLERLAGGGIDVVLLDLSLPESKGMETFLRAHSQAPATPVIVLTGLDDEALAVEAVKQGAQDYLVKGQISARWLGSSISYAIERQKKNSELEQAYQKLKETQASLVKAEKMASISQMGVTLSHEINNPLSIILMNAGLLRGKLGEGELTAKQLKESAEEICHQARRIEKVVTEVQEITEPATREYIKGVEMIDLGKNKSGDREKEGPNKPA